ncbi:MAG: tRNA (cytidine(34)-2'-O)-methyltransferase [Pseudomonadota bacterium]|nr:tRNA (cytidine(34)-2'-O)-methyltransferase [Pseudomonadota bacterium]
MINIVLYQPEIPPNTGNIIRLCANTNCILHIILPTAFDFSSKKVRRAGLDYHELTNLIKYDNWEKFYAKHKSEQIIAYSTKAKRRFDSLTYAKNTYLLFGPETKGLPNEILENSNIQKARIPMNENSRSINLSNSVAIGLFEALRQDNYGNLK